MPIKLGKSYKNIDRQTKKVTTHHPYIRGFSKADLIEKYNADNTRPKDKQKIKKLLKKISIKDITKIFVEEKNVSKKEIYNYCLFLKNEN